MEIVFYATVFLLTVSPMNFQRDPYKDCPLNNKYFFTKTGKCISRSLCASFGFLSSSQAKNLDKTDCKSFLRDLACCPLLEEYSTYRSLSRKAEKKCWEYHSKLANFVAQGDTSFSAVGAEEAVEKEFPHMAAIGYVVDGTTQWLCGGSLISENFVLTAAHCINYGDTVASIVRLGELDFTYQNSTFRDIPISERIVHPHYNSSHYDDIALLKLSRKPVFRDYIRPACLHMQYDVPRELQAIGWGKTAFIGFKSDHLLKVTLKVTDFNVCFERYKKINPQRLHKGIEDITQICAGGNSEKDTCEGDSGGPFHYSTDETEKFKRYYTVAGITSFGHGCGFGRTPAVFTRVSTYVPWIENIVWP